jgi:hypothetical protein
MPLPTQQEMFAMSYDEMWAFMLTQPNYFLVIDEMDCNGNCEHLEHCFICS